MSTTDNLLVGYSSNDFFYENPAYCGQKDKDNKYPGETHSMANINSTPADENKNDNVNRIQTLCITNEKYGEQMKAKNSGLTTSSSRYDHTMRMYNRELLTTMNYIAGIGLIVAYIYMNQRI